MGNASDLEIEAQPRLHERADPAFGDGGVGRMAGIGPEGRFIREGRIEHGVGGRSGNPGDIDRYGDKSGDFSREALQTGLDAGLYPRFFRLVELVLEFPQNNVSDHLLFPSGGFSA